MGQTLEFMVYTVILNVILGLRWLRLEASLFREAIFSAFSFAPPFFPVSVLGIIGIRVWDTPAGDHQPTFLPDIFMGPRVSWLGEPGNVIPVLSVTTVWWTVGFPAGIHRRLQNIPDHLYKAAKIDGAGPFQDILFHTIH